ncbi:MAG: DUF1194 domain-containing protein [Arenibacterium sp.]
MWRIVFSVPALLLWLLPSQSETLEVDIELFLAVDVSRSMSPYELEIQRRGYAEALTSPRVIEAITGGMIGRIAITYVEWAGSQSQTVIIPWTLIDEQSDATAIAERLTAFFSEALRRTSISEALIYAADSFETNAFNGLRRVIDISGDGPNNQGRPVLAARDDVLARRITINGLPLMTVDEISLRWGIPDLDVYYTNCVIGGPGAFVVPVLSWDQFAEAVERKLVLEISNLAPPIRPSASIVQIQGYDCLIGEKIWQRNQSDFFLP